MAKYTPPTTGIPTKTIEVPTDGAAGGFGEGYRPPTRAPQPGDEGYGYGPAEMTQFGTISRYQNDDVYDMYTSDDAYSLPLQDPTTIPDLQRQLIQAGFLDVKDIRQFGLWDNKSANAYAQVLAFANQYGLDANDAMTVLIDNPAYGDTIGPTPRTISLTNPADVQAGFRNTSLNMVGQELPTAAFEQTYRAQELAQNRDPTQDYTQAPSVQGAAEDFLLDNNRTDMQNYGAASRMLSFFDLLRSG